MVATNYLISIFSLVTVLRVDCIEAAQKTKCPASKGLMKRVGNTRYYVFHNPRGKSDKFYNWDEAKKFCSEKKDFKMATIEKLTTFAEVGRALEKLVTKHALLDTWYWLDAKYNNEQQVYHWGGDVSRPLKYTNFFYRYPRPTGLGGFVDRYKAYKINKTTEQCLTLALPYPAAHNMKPAENRGGMIFGYSATFDERPCTSKKTIHAICESTLPECTSTQNDPFTLTEDKDAYFEEGVWVLGGRYVVNWKQRTKKESEDYCNEHGLALFSPTSKESDFIPHLKMWSRGITVSQFWTNWEYRVSHPGNGLVGEFVDTEGTTRATIRSFVNISSIDDFESSRSDKYDKSLCVAMQVSSELKKTQYPCPDGHESTCNWNFIQYVPANCNNLLGTLCDYLDLSLDVRAKWKKKWIKNPLDFLNNATEFSSPFAYGWNDNSIVTGFKQTFGSLVCPKGFRMPRINDTRWHRKTGGTVVLFSDYLLSYWVIDDEGFQKSANSLCSLSTPVDDGYVRAIKRVPCTEWHFYICDRIVYPIKERKYNLPYDIPKYASWDDRFERHYPIL